MGKRRETDKGDIKEQPEKQEKGNWVQEREEVRVSRRQWSNETSAS